MGEVTQEPKVKTHSAEYFRQRRAQQREARNDYDQDDPFYHRRFVEAGRELAALMELPVRVTPTPPADNPMRRVAPGTFPARGFTMIGGRT